MAKNYFIIFLKPPMPRSADVSHATTCLNFDKIILLFLLHIIFIHIFFYYITYCITYFSHLFLYRYKCGRWRCVKATFSNVPPSISRSLFPFIHLLQPRFCSSFSHHIFPFSTSARFCFILLFIFLFEFQFYLIFNFP